MPMSGDDATALNPAGSAATAWVASHPPPRYGSAGETLDGAEEQRWGWAKYGGLRAGLSRVGEVTADLPLLAKFLLAAVFLLNVTTVVTVSAFVHTNIATWVALSALYGLFQYAYTFHAVYAQNEYALVSSVVLQLIEAAYFTIDWKQDFTGRDIPVSMLVIQWVLAVAIIALMAAVYWEMDGFGWKALRDVGALKQQLEVHQAYRRFAACINADIFVTFISGVLALVLIDWTPCIPLVVVNVLPTVLLWYPLKRAVRHERKERTMGLLVPYGLGACIWAAGLVFAVAKARGHFTEYRRLTRDGTHFPSAATLTVCCSLALLIRCVLLFLVSRCVRHFGAGVLRRMHVARRRDAPSKVPNDSLPTQDGGPLPTRYDYVAVPPTPGSEPRSSPGLPPERDPPPSGGASPPIRPLPCPSPPFSPETGPVGGSFPSSRGRHPQRPSGGGLVPGRSRGDSGPTAARVEVQIQRARYLKLAQEPDCEN